MAARRPMIAGDSGEGVIAKGHCAGSAWGLLACCALDWAGATGVVRGAPLDFLFGEPPVASRPAYRLRRRPAPPLTRPPAETTQVEVPLPVLRPHFAGDPPTAAARVDDAPSSPLAAAPPPPAQTATAKPIETPPAAADAPPPLPPPKPAELERPAAAPETPKTGPSPPPTPPKVAEPGQTKPEPAKPDSSKPPVAASGATTAFTPRAPQDDPQCPSRLQGLHVDVAPVSIPPQPDARCTVVQPVRLAGMALADGAKIEFPEHPTIACTTADAFSAYLRDLLVPLAKGTFGAPLTAVWTGPGLECRARDSVFGAKLSAHGQGLAIDIAILKLGDGRRVEVGTPKTDAETRFETAARAGACGYFHTVLGPGSDAYHRTHWHFDLEVRGKQGDSKYCK